jgi:hypothetical protein
VKRFVVIGTLTAVASAAAVYWMRPDPVPPLAQVDTPAPASVGKQAPDAASEQLPDRREQVEPASALDDEQSASTRRGAFHDRARAFFAEAPALDAAERTRRAAEIEREIDEHEASRALSAGEAFVLRSALIRETVEDEDLRDRELRALAERYRTDAERRIAAATRADPEFELYKAREAEIAAEVMAMTEIPGGLSRDEYLRRRLQAEREALLGDR